MSHADRERAVARRVAIGLVAIFVALWIVRLILGIATGSLTDQSSLALDLVFDAGAIVFSTLIPLVGWAIVTRQPRNTIGWLLMMVPILGIFGFVVGDYATEALVYAGATWALITLTHADTHLVFEVGDDGSGFDVERVRDGTGLQGMADRLDAIGGSLTIRSVPGEGSIVGGQVPVA
jgi:hypothetical protein